MLGPHQVMLTTTPVRVTGSLATSCCNQPTTPAAATDPGPLHLCTQQCSRHLCMMAVVLSAISWLQAPRAAADSSRQQQLLSWSVW
jgi:hypothetical protein